MTRTEFEKKVCEVTNNANYFRAVALSQTDYKKIEYVYTWHPSISETDGKCQIAWIYANLGMCIINDMYETASLMQDLTNELQDAQKEVNRIKEQIECVRKGQKYEWSKED